MISNLVLLKTRLLISSQLYRVKVTLKSRDIAFVIRLSSANDINEEYKISLSISLIKIRKKGPKTDPWGTRGHRGGGAAPIFVGIFFKVRFAKTISSTLFSILTFLTIKKRF